MNAFVTEFAAPVAVTPNKAEAFIRQTTFDHPTLVVDSAAVARNYAALSTGLGHAKIHYAVKANPAPQIIATLAGLGSNFDAASRGEVALCLSMGVSPDRISFGNTIKKSSDIAWAFSAGIRLFAADAEEELEKLAVHAPASQVYIRVIVDASQADWPLSRKFGCARDKVLSLIAYATELGLNPIGLSFHVGSQTRRADMWAPTLDQIAAIWHSAIGMGYPLSMLNIGGGFPAFYGQEIDAPADYAAAVMGLIADRFGDVAHVMAEPGRGMVADAGAISCEVMLVSRKSDFDMHRWVYLDIGRFSGLAETEGEAIRYTLLTDRDGDARGACVLAGPSCDSADVLYEKRPVDLPLTLAAGDRVIIRNCGAYTSSYSSVGFNGFPPLDVVVI